MNITATRKPRRRPATTVEGRENQLISLAVDVAEEQMRTGKASAQVITHYLKLGTTRERLEQERLIRENALLTAKVEALASAAKVEELYERALQAMRSYSGAGDEAYEIEELHSALPDRRLSGEVSLSAASINCGGRKLRLG